MNTQEYLNKSNLSNSVNFIELPMEKIDEYINLLTDFQGKCVKEGKFVEAEIAKQRISQLKNVQDKKMLEEVKKRHQEEKMNLESSQKEELDNYNIKKDQELYSISNKFSEMEYNLEAQHEKELNKLEEDFENNYSKSVKPSSELIKQNKLLELYVKKEDFQNAHLVQVEIARLSKLEEDNFLVEKQKKLEREIEALKKKQNNEKQALELKKNNIYGEFKRKRALEVQSLLMSYKNKFRELEAAQKKEQSLYEQLANNDKKKDPKIKAIRNQLKTKKK